ncbi:tRNA epoxyqueuosine(34) reductase QueG [Parvibaculaceae bacterium PLY_AMNH_Bact1]|nr:tRNA epoxyqueuosine(34) reductase QueG [Parvibaculaceae bacterium PLY_AMNH_Bact1]
MSTTAQTDVAALKAEIIAQAKAAGFDDVGFSSADLSEKTQRDFQEWLDRGAHGDMAWMEETRERRASPKALWPDVKSVIVLAMNYGPDGDPLETLQHPDKANISVYARNRDYHDLVKKRSKRIARWLVEETGCELKVFVDTAPILEKPVAAGSSLGWQGKHTNLVSNELGSWFFIGSIFTNLDLPTDASHADQCGSCHACLDACPTDAFPSPYELDARRCISYLTIEHKGHIAPEFRGAMANRIYGCDDCLAACPWNKFARAASELSLKPREDLTSPVLRDLLALDDKEFRALFAGSPIKRIGRDRFLRNVLIAAGNSGDEALLPQITDHLGDASVLVRAMAVWALGQLASVKDVERLRLEHSDRETDSDVKAEWERLPSLPR